MASVIPMRLRRPAAVLPIVLLSLPCGLRAGMFSCPGGDWPWDGQGPFVNVPAGIAASPGGLAGTALALAFSPADLIEAGLHPRQKDDPVPRFAHAGICGGVYLGKGLALAAGSPFWLLKRALWDGPKRLFSRKASDNGSSAKN